LLIATIKAVEQIDYPDFEIIVMDNNTADEATWRPVEEYCRGRERVKFVHVAPWPGYKAGACNLALRRYTDPRAEIIAMIDADDIVKPYYLRETIGYFADQHIGFVQTFEGNRDYEGSAYYTACVDSYQGFYLAVMSSRNERDTVPFVGTMGLFRRSALEGVGGWNEWCISEDTEASLRVLKAGWSGLYIPRCFGRGIVPPALLTTTSMRPNSDIACATMSSIASFSFTSQGITSARRPKPRTTAATSSSCSFVRAASTMSAPASAYRNPRRIASSKPWSAAASVLATITKS
jgi:cellulose synthase/poly-beta-1,6-N-acetylglucosamine synthase-like glycosyltransferase